jgi:hypothetical protein
MHIEMTEAKAFGTCIRMYSVLQNERLSANIKLSLQKAQISNDLRLTRLGNSGRHLPLQIAAPS